MRFWQGTNAQCQGADQGSCPFLHSFPHVPVQFFHFQVYMLILPSQGCSSAGFIEGLLGAWLLLKNSSGEQKGRSRTFFFFFFLRNLGFALGRMLSSLWNHFWFSERKVLSGSGPCKFCSFKAQFCPALNLISTCLQKISRFIGILHFVQILYLLIFRHFFRVSIAPFVHAQTRRIICIHADFFLPVSFERKVF